MGTKTESYLSTGLVPRGARRGDTDLAEETRKSGADHVIVVFVTDSSLMRWLEIFLSLGVRREVARLRAKSIQPPACQSERTNWCEVEAVSVASVCGVVERTFEIFVF